MEPSSKSRYVSRATHGEQVGLQPGVVMGAKTWTFLLQGDAVAAQKLVDQQLNAVEKVSFRVLSLPGFGCPLFLSFLDGEKLFSKDAPEMGFSADQECSFWIPLLYRNNDGFLGWEFAFWMPYVIVDTAVAMATGYEVWGFFKEIGKIHIPRGTQGPTNWGADAMLFQSLNPETKGDVERLVTVSKESDLRQSQKGRFSLRPMLSLFLRKLARLAKTRPVFGDNTASPPLESWITFVNLILKGKQVPLVNLKQFRDVEDPDLACYQALIHSTITIQKVHQSYVMKDDFTLSIGRAASHPIVHDLGLKGQQSNVIAAFYSKMDFEVDPGRELK